VAIRIVVLRRRASESTRNPERLSDRVRPWARRAAGSGIRQERRASASRCFMPAE
jgi:hypothetical protein